MNFASCKFETLFWDTVPQNSPKISQKSAIPTVVVYIVVPPKMMDGWPGVLAFLNGCDLRSALRGQVLLAKMFGTILAVGGGLALGPEGLGG